MKKYDTLLGLMAIGLIFSFLPLSVQASTVEYSADVLPEASTPAWTKVLLEYDNDVDTTLDVSVAAEEIQNGVLHTAVNAIPYQGNQMFCTGCHETQTNGSQPWMLRFNTNYWPASYTIEDSSLSNQQGTSVEARVKASKLDLGISISDGEFIETLLIRGWPNNGQIALMYPAEGIDDQGGQVYIYSTYGVNTTDDFHTYRMTVKGTRVDVYVDCELVLTRDAPHLAIAATSDKHIRFGNIAHAKDTIASDGYFDYVKYSASVTDFGNTCGGNAAPVADAGDNLTISSEEVSSTIIQGIATDADGDSLACRWYSGVIELKGWTPVEAGGKCSLDLSTVSLSLGSHVLSLEVNDNKATSKDEMILTIGNSPPNAAPSGGSVYEVGTDVTLNGSVSDFDGDGLDYVWSDGVNVFCTGSLTTISGGTPVKIDPCIISNLTIGDHVIYLEVKDNFNGPVTANVNVKVIDDVAPTMKPVINHTLLWPPNHKMVDIVIGANATDNSGLPVTLNAIIQSNEPQDGLGDGDTAPDWTTPVIDNNAGTLSFQLRAERSGSGTGRAYTITLFATDIAGNTNTADIKVVVPHDNKKK